MPWPAGARLGPYQIIAPLGAGGMGEVYKARDTRLDRTVAIKTLLPDLALVAARGSDLVSCTGGGARNKI